MSICLVLQCCDGCEAREIAAWLSTKILIGCVRDTPISANSCLSQSNSLIVSTNARYSASQVETATVGCNFDFQLIGPTFVYTTYPVRDFLVLWQVAQSLSEKASRESSLLPVRCCRWFQQDSVVLSLLLANV